jgi:hypothetical protein
MPSNNEVTITGPTDGLIIKSMSYIKGSFHITTGEDGDPPPSFKNTGSVWTIAIAADRKGSKPVADGYTETVGGIGYLAANGGGDRPNDLNFYFGVDIGFQFPGEDNIHNVPVYLGQGHYVATNNWWFGGSQFFKCNSFLLVIGGSQILQTFKIKLDTHAFTLTPQ